jgi:hypothetical protein
MNTNEWMIRAGDEKSPNIRRCTNSTPAASPSALRGGVQLCGVTAYHRLVAKGRLQGELESALVDRMQRGVCCLSGCGTSRHHSSRTTITLKILCQRVHYGLDSFVCVSGTTCRYTRLRRGIYTLLAVCAENNHSSY